MCGCASDEDRARRVDPVRSCERERQPRQRRPAPAARRAGGVRAERTLDRAGDLGRQARDAVGERVDGAARTPVEDQVRRRPVAGDGESPVELDGPTREVAVESAADEVLVCAGVGGVVHLGRVLVARRRPLPPGAYLANPAAFTIRAGLPVRSVIYYVGEQPMLGFEPAK